MPPRNPATEESLRALRAVAGHRPLTLEEYGQVSSILAANQDCLTYLAAAVRVVQVSLQHPPRDPTAPPPAFMACGLFHSISSMTAEIIGDVIRPTTLIVLELVYAALHTLLATPVTRCLSSQQLGEPSDKIARQIINWVPLIPKFADGQPVGSFAELAWLSGAAAQHSSDDVRRYRKAWAFVTSEVLGEPAAEAEFVLGTSNVLYANSLVLLLDVLHKQRRLLDMERPNFRTQFSPDDRSAVERTQQLAAMLHQDELLLPLPNGALACALNEFMGRVQFTAAGHLLTEPEVLRNLATPLQALAKDPGLWRGGAYAYHVQTLEDLCRWAGSFQGTPAVDRISVRLVQPTAAALGSLLQLGPGERTGAAHLVQATLRLMTHFAATESGRIYLARANCVTRWLELAAGWKQQPGVLHRLLIAVAAPFCNLDGPSQRRRLPTYLGYFWKLNRLDPQLFQCGVGPGDLFAQAKSSKAFAAVSALADASLDDVSWVLLHEFRTYGMRAGSIIEVQPRFDALLTYSKPPAIGTLRQRYGAGKDVEGYVSLGTQHALERLVLTYKLQTLAKVCVAMAANTLVPASQPAAVLPPFPTEAMPALAEWLAFLQHGGAMNEYGSTICPVLPSFFHRFTWDSTAHTRFLREHHALQRLCDLLPGSVGAEYNSESTASVPLAMACVMDALLSTQPGQLPWQQLTACAHTKDLPACLAASAGCWQDVYQQLVAWQPAVLSKSTARALELAKQAGPARVLKLLGVVAASWGDAEAAACKVLLQDSPVVWTLLDILLTDTTEGARYGLDAWLHFLHKQLQQGDAEQRRLARDVVVRQLGRRTVNAALAQVTLPLPWRQYKREFELLFEDGTAGQADKPRLAGAAIVEEQAAGSAAGIVEKGQQDVGCNSKQATGSTANASACASTSGPRTCSVCGAQPEQTFVCSRCTRVRYCSAQCQRGDWKQHKLVCKKV